MVGQGSKTEGPIFKCVSHPLYWSEKIGRRRVDEQKMLESFRNESPAANEWVAQNEGGIVPDKSGAQGGRMRANDKSQKRGENGQPLLR